MNYTKHDKNMEIITVKKELSLEFEKLVCEELECGDNKPEEFGTMGEQLELQNVPVDTDASKVSACQNDQESSQIITKQEIVSTCQNDVESSQIIIKEEIEFGIKVTELLGLQNESTDTDASKVLQDPLKLEERSLHVKQDVESKLDIEDSEQKVSMCQNDQESSHIIIKEEIDCDVDDGSVSGLVSLSFADKVAGTTLRRSSRRRCQRFTVGDLLESSSDETSVSKHNKKVRIQTYSHCNCEKRLSTARGARRPEGRSKSSERCEVCGKFYELFCDICGQRFSMVHNLRRHAATHSASKRYTCGQCGKSFSRSDNLKEHERLHSGQKYRCAECGKEFLQRGRMSKHARTHTHAGEQQFHCADCGKVFHKRASLREHMRIHTAERPYNCADCGKAFRCRRNLRHHVRVHMDERPFTCRVCGKAFRQSAGLTGHARLHTGDRRHSCDACGRLFYRKHHLKVHVCMRMSRRGKLKKQQS